MKSKASFGPRFEKHGLFLKRKSGKTRVFRASRPQSGPTNKPKKESSRILI